MFALIARIVPGLGIVFAALVVAAYVLESGAPGDSSDDFEWVTYYADSGNRHKAEVAFVLIGLAGLCFLLFLGSLRGALARAEGEPSWITTTAVASGAAFIALAMAAHVVGTTLAWSQTLYLKDLTIDPNTARLLDTLAYLLFAMSLFAAAGMALAVAAIGLTRQALPPWLAWLSVLAAVAGVTGTLGLPAMVVLLWIAALSLSLAWPSRATRV